MPDRVRVLVADDHRVIAEGLAALIRDTSDLEVVGIAGSAAEAIEASGRLTPDVVLLDHLLPDRAGVDAIGDLRTACPEAAVVMLTSSTDETVLAAAFEAGAAGHLLKTQAASQVLEAIRGAAQGESHVARSTLAGVLRKAKAERVPRRRAGTLTPREMDVLRALAAGEQTAEIAKRLGLTIPTVRTYVQEILRKLGSRSRLQAVMHAVRGGLL